MKLKVLIAEDEPAHAEAILRGLETADMKVEVRVAGTLREFRELAAAEPPDIALMDLNLSDGRAMEALTFPPEDGPFPILIMTSFGNEQAAVEAIKGGALDYLVKSPETFSGMRRTVERALREWRLVQEKKESEEALGQSRQLYQTFLDSTSDMAFLKDEQFRHLIANQRLLDFFGKPIQEVIGKSDFDLMPADAAENCRRTDRAALAVDAVSVSEERAGARVFESSKFPVKLSSGRRGIGGYIRDVTEKRQAEETLRRSQTLLQDIADNSPSLIYVTDIEGRFILVNKKLQMLLGMSQDRLIGNTRHNVLPQEIADQHRLNDLEVLLVQQPLTFEEENRESDGVHTYSTMKFPLMDSKGNMYAIGGISTDTTDSRRAGEAMKARLRITSASFEKSSKELMQMTLDEIEEQTGSSIGFFHFLLEDQETFSLQAWSTNTLRNMCTAEGEGSHYPISEAGVWTDCVHERRPVIHNDYNALSHRKGMPSGHAPVRRELVVPIFRDERIVAIIGVGNKPTEFTAVDVEIISHLGDFSWEIIERKQAEQALLESESKYRRLYDSLMDAFIRVDMSGRIMEFNQAYEALLGYSAEEFHRLTYVDLTPERWHSFERDLVKNQILVRGYSDIYEKEYRKKDGTEFPVEMRTFLIRDAAGRPEGMWAIVRDISERKRIEEALRKTEEKYSKAFQASPDWIVITTLAKGVFIEVNKAFESLSGFGREEVLGRTATEIGIWDKPEERRRLTDRLQREGSVHNMEARFRLQSGTARTFLLSAEVIEVEGQACVLTVARDMTELRSLEGQLRQAQKMEAVGRLAGGVAHDFNNMLGVILGYTDLALKRLNAQEPLYHDLQEVHNAARRSADLTRQLLAFSRKQIVAPKVLSLNDAVTQQQKMLGRLIGEDIDLKFIPGQDLWNARLDSSQVDQILANLAVNARDAIAGVGTVTIETANVTLDERYTRRHPYATPGDYVLLAVSDSGSGMDGETLERIFEPFFTTKGEGQGTGLGLSTVYGIVKQNKGSIQAYSEPGRGTTLKIYFPRFLGEAVPVEPVQETILSGSETVLIVEDEPQILLLAKRILEHYGYKTMEAGSPGEALLLLEKHRGPLHLLLTDVIMPHMTGLELKGRVEALHPGILTLFMSGYTQEVISERGLLDEKWAFIQKPFTVQDLAGKVRRVLDG
jgi:two-component system cell cycle sensor histidine kinase/response regulator CckA